MIEPGQNQIQNLCTEQSYQRGLRYFQEGRVKIIDASASRIVATVMGTQSYRVEIDLDKFSADCNCPYDWEGYCKHIVATFLAIDNEQEKVNKMMDEMSEELTGMYALLEPAETNALKDFLRRELEAQPSLRARFIARFSSSGKGKSLSDYKDEIDSLFDDVEERGFIPYG
ncbi:MAG TPA: SWIM zinc finger family protein, partial [Methanothrix sp.]|nr:SWIM zinc finger family protein [Methanothrix sp.]